VRQGDGATVQPLIEASFDVLGPMIFHGGRVDAELLRDMIQVMRPLLFEMSRLAIERFRPQQLDALRRLRNRIADETRDREERFAAVRELQVLLSDMTQNRVWQMLARRLRAFLASDPLRETRRRLKRDPAPVVLIIDACLAAIDAGRRADAVSRLRELIHLVGENELDDALARGPRRLPRRPELARAGRTEGERR